MRKSSNTTYLGEYNIPTKWEDITLKQFQKILELDNKNDNIAILSILLGKDKNEVMQLPDKVLKLFNEKITFMQNEPIIEASNILTINGEEYIINDKDNLKVGEYSDFNEIVKYDRNNYAFMLAILARKSGEVYDDKFIAEELENRIKMFENIPVTDALATVNFFLQKYVLLKNNSQLYTEMVKEDVESLIAENIKSLRANGGFMLPSRLRSIIKLMKLKKRIKSI